MRQDVRQVLCIVSLVQEDGSEKARLLEQAGTAQAEVQRVADDLAEAKADVAAQLESAIAARKSCEARNVKLRC